MLRTHAAAVLGHDAPATIAPDDNFLELGLSSFTSLELSNRVKDETGMVLPPAAIFDHPTPLALARFLRTELATARRT